ncbi:alpha-L-rhamnosidase C-terminal domain-containing protein [Candidatus Poribacteria bacterium]
MSLIVNHTIDGRWRAAFAWSAERGGPGFCIRRFRRSFDLNSVPDEFLVSVSADSRYRLFVNGQRVGRGPLKGELKRYHYETYDVREFLKDGRNVMAAEVVWFGFRSPNSEIHSGYAGFLLQGPEDTDIDTPGAWKVQIDHAVTPDTTPYSNITSFLDHLERVDGREYPVDWLELDFDDSGWEKAVFVCPADVDPYWGEMHPVWNLVPRDVPMLIEEPRRFARTIYDMKPGEHLFGDSPAGWTLDSGQAGEIVLDAGTLTTGFPELHFQGGNGRTVEIVYGEQVQEKATVGDRTPMRKKTIRDELEDGVINGYRDTVILPGGEFHYEPFHWRTFWFIRINVSAGDEPFALKDISYRFTTWPQELAASYESADPDSGKMLEISWRTLQLCSHETYEDCPYYEQLNYIFDTRNEALCSLAMAGETRLPRRSITLFRNSMRPDGLIHCRVPSRRTHRLPYFALAWVLMIQDYWEWVGPQDADFVRSNLFAVDGVLSWFRGHLRNDNLIGKLPYWNPIGGHGEGGSMLGKAVKDGGSTYLTSLYLTAINAAIRLHREVGYRGDADRWVPWAKKIKAAILKRCWEEERGLFAESPKLKGQPVSQHSQVQPILAGVASPDQCQRIMEKLTTDAVSGYMLKPYGYYLARALEQTGHYEEFHRYQLEDYRQMMGRHLTTWQEGSEPGRSDCHAWTSWPAVDFLTTVLGIKPGKPGFEEILIKPQFIYDHASGQMPTVQGLVQVDWRKHGDGIELRIEGPPEVPITVQLPGQETEFFPAGGSVSIDA